MVDNTLDTETEVGGVDVRDMKASYGNLVDSSKILRKTNC